MSKFMNKLLVIFIMIKMTFEKDTEYDLEKYTRHVEGIKRQYEEIYKDYKKNYDKRMNENYLLIIKELSKRLEKLYTNLNDYITKPTKEITTDDKKLRKKFINLRFDLDEFAEQLKNNEKKPDL